MALIGRDLNFMLSMSRSLKDNFVGKNTKKSLKYSQRYDVALLGSRGIRQWPFKILAVYVHDSLISCNN